MKKIKKIIVTIVCAALCLSCLSFVACDKPAVSPPTYKDVIERPEIDEIPVSEFIKYPEFPAVKPIIDDTATPVIYDYATSGYTKTDGENNVTFAYQNVEDWSYIYAKAQDVSPLKANFKITLTADGAEKIFIQAIYYEMKENQCNAVTVYSAGLSDGNQFVIAELKNFFAIDKGYYSKKDLPLNKATILGFMIFIDSNPKSLVSDKNGSVTINSFEFLNDGDPALADKYIKPSVNGGLADPGYTITSAKGAHTITTQNPGIYTMARLNIVNYSKNFAEFTFEATLANVTKCSIGLGFGGGDPTWQPYIEFDTKLSQGTHTYTFNFEGISPISLATWDYVPGYFVKDYAINTIQIWMDTGSGAVPQAGASLVIKDIEFTKTVSSQTKVSKVWSSSSSNIKIIDSQEGGKGNISYSYYNSWDYMLMNVGGYTMDANSLTVSLQAAQNLANIGIAVMADGKEVVLHSSNDKIDTQNMLSAVGLLEGLKESIVIDAANRIYNYTFDFSKLVNTSGAHATKLNQKMITGIRFYFNEPDEPENPKPLNPFDGERNIRFINVEFKI